jgi:nitrogen fixation protein
MVAIGEDDEADDDIYDVTLMTKDEHSPADASGPVVLFSDTEVLLDNQAGRSVFRNPGLLTDLRKLKTPIYIGGVDGSSKGIRVDADGSFEDLGHVGICGPAAANILSKAEMVDACHRISYVNDEYHLDGDGVVMVFRRKLLGGSGHKSNHYSCEMADVASAATLPVTLEANMREYSHREVTKARELMARLAYASSSTMLELLGSGGLYTATSFRLIIVLVNGCLYCVLRSHRDYKMSLFLRKAAF